MITYYLHNTKNKKTETVATKVSIHFVVDGTAQNIACMKINISK